MIIVILLISSLVNGISETHREEMKTLPECWKKAAAALEYVAVWSRQEQSYIIRNRNPDLKIQTIGAGCYLEDGVPA